MKKRIVLGLGLTSLLVGLNACCKEETVYVDRPVPVDLDNKAPVVHCAWMGELSSSGFWPTYRFQSDSLQVDNQLDSLTPVEGYNAYRFYITEQDQTVALGYQKPTDYTYTIETDYPIEVKHKTTPVKLESQDLGQIHLYWNGPFVTTLVQPGEPLTFTGDRYEYMRMGYTNFVGGGFYNYRTTYYELNKIINVKVIVKDKYGAQTVFRIRQKLK